MPLQCLGLCTSKGEEEEIDKFTEGSLSETDSRRSSLDNLHDWQNVWNNAQDCAEGHLANWTAFFKKFRQFPPRGWHSGGHSHHPSCDKMDLEIEDDDIILAEEVPLRATSGDINELLEKDVKWRFPLDFMPPPVGLYKTVGSEKVSACMRFLMDSTCKPPCVLLWGEEERALWKRVDSWKVSVTMVSNLASSMHIAFAVAVLLIEEYKRFMFLVITCDSELTPSLPVDEVWHLHLSMTDDYEKFCEKTAGKYVHHNIGDGSQNCIDKFHFQYIHTMYMYCMYFGPVCFIPKFRYESWAHEEIHPPALTRRMTTRATGWLRPFYHFTKMCQKNQDVIVPERRKSSMPEVIPDVEYSNVWTQAQKNKWEKLDTWDFPEAMERRLCKQESIPIHQARVAIEEYRRFMFLNPAIGGFAEPVVPSLCVDIVWTLHILFSCNYREFIQAMCIDAKESQPLHNPLLNGPDQLHDIQKTYSYTYNLYRMYFKEPLRVKSNSFLPWPTPEDRFSQKLNRMSTRLNQLRMSRRNSVTLNANFVSSAGQCAGSLK